MPLFESSGTRPGPGADRTVLIVDDSDLVRGLIRELLQETGARLIEAARPAEALAAARVSQQPVHVLITDMMLPGMSGVELAKQLRRYWPGLNVVLISADPGAALDADMVSGATFLEKTFLVEKLTERIRGMWDHPHNLNREIG